MDPNRFIIPGEPTSGVKEIYYGKSIGEDEAFQEGYCSKYHQWTSEHRENPYPEGSAEWLGWENGYADAASWA
jgi:hypothetical protein